MKQFDNSEENINNNDNQDVMTASYSEISFPSSSVAAGNNPAGIASIPEYKEKKLSQRPITLGYGIHICVVLFCRVFNFNIFVLASFPYNLEGTVSVDGKMTNFVAENLEYKIKLASPVLRKSKYL